MKALSKISTLSYKINDVENDNLHEAISLWKFYKKIKY